MTSASSINSPARLDPRTTLAWAATPRPERGAVWDVADAALEGLLAANRYVSPEPMQVAAAACALRRDPAADAEQVDQLLCGERFHALTFDSGHAYGQARRDGYVGWVAREALSTRLTAPTHWVRALRTFVFAEASIKAPVLACLSTNALVRVEALDGRLARLDGGGWAPFSHLAEIGVVERDPAAVALRYQGAPYLWGGRDSVGLDCSGLVQQALYACGLGGPRDSDMQAGLGAPVGGVGDLVRNDLVFWRGHVAMMLDAYRMIHANGHHMAVTVEPLAEAIARIAEAGGGEPIAFRRLPGLPREAGDAPR